MALKDLMVLLDLSEQSTRRLALAALLAARYGAHLKGVCLAEAIRPIEPIALTADAYAFGTGIVGFLEQVKAERVRQLKPVETGLNQALARDGLRGEWVLAEGAPVPACLAHARLADLVIAGQTDPEGGPDQPTVNPLEEILLASGRPLMVVPRYGTFPTCGETVLVGWTDTREATRAVHDALPILAAARSVSVLAIRTDHEEEGWEAEMPAAGMAEHLARHGCRAVAAATVAGGLAPADVLLNYASDIGADLVVVGGYGHSRVRELALGGVTRALFQHMTVPVLFAH